MYKNKFKNYLEYLNEIEVNSFIEVENKIVKDINEKIDDLKKNNLMNDFHKNKFIDLLKGLRFVLRKGKKPMGVNENELYLYLPLINRLVKNEIFEDTILNLFKEGKN